MKALTILQPWATAIALSDPARLGEKAKLLENRGWKPPAYLVGQSLAIHAGKAVMDEDDVHEVAERLGLDFGDFARWCIEHMGRVVAVARVQGYRETAPEGLQAKWWIGPIGWVLTDTQSIKKPVSCRGMQGIWNLPVDVEQAVREQVSL